MGEIVSIVFPFVLGGAIYAWGYRVGVRVGVARGEYQAARRQREAMEREYATGNFMDLDLGDDLQ
jgi:hypothetical protein